MLSALQAVAPAGPVAASSGSALLRPGLQPTGSCKPPSTSAADRHGSRSAAASGGNRGGVRRGGCGASAGTTAAVFGLVTLPRFLQPTQAPAGAGVLLCKFSSYL